MEEIIDQPQIPQCLHTNGMIGLGQNVVPMNDGILIVVSLYCPVCLHVDTKLNPVKFGQTSVFTPPPGLRV